MLPEKQRQGTTSLKLVYRPDKTNKNAIKSTVKTQIGTCTENRNLRPTNLSQNLKNNPLKEEPFQRARTNNRNFKKVQMFEGKRK